jgi:hypothetical protein
MEKEKPEMLNTSSLSIHTDNTNNIKGSDLQADKQTFSDLTPLKKHNCEWFKTTITGAGTFSAGFWNFSIKLKADMTILIYEGVCRTNIFEILEMYGFCKIYRHDGSYIFVREIDNILRLVTSAQIKDFCIDLINDLPNEISVEDFKIQSIKLKEIFLREQHILFGEKVLSPLRTHTKEMLRDNEFEMYFPYLNGVVKVTKQNIEIVPYSSLKDVCIWENHIIQRAFNFSTTRSMFDDFLSNIMGNNTDRIHSVKCAIGYLLHRYYSAKCTKAVVLYDEQMADANSAHGGTGKGMVANAISKLRETATINGKRFDTTERFALQNVCESTQIVFLDDILPTLDFEYFNSILTDGWEFEQKNKTTIRIPFENSPKLLVSSNQIMRTKKGETASRRQFIVEVAPFYSMMLERTQTPVVDVHGCEFFGGWNTEQWNEFDTLMLQCAQMYLVNGLPVNEVINVKNNRLLQQTSNEFIEWLDDKDFHTKKLYNSTENYNEFKNLYVGEYGKFSQNQFVKWLKLYADTYKLEYKTTRYNNATHFSFEQ